MKQKLIRLLQVVVTLGLLGWIFRDAALRHEMLRVLRGADPRWLFLGVIIAGLGDFSNMLRWSVFLRAQDIRTPWRRIASLFMTGLFFNLFLFGTTGGDVVRIVYLVREHPERRAAVVLTVIADRLIGLFVLIPFALVVVWLRYDWLAQTALARTLLWFVLGFLLIATLVLGGASLIAGSGALDRLPARFPGREKIVKVGVTYHVFAYRWKAMLLAWLLSFPVLFTFFGTFYCASRAFNAGISLVDFCSIMPIIAVVTSFPISISGLGVREKLFEDLLRDLAGVPGETGVLISLAGFVIYLFWSLVGALVYICFPPHDRLSLKQLRAEASHPEE